MTHIDMRERGEPLRAPRHLLRNTFLLLVFLALLTAGGWWANQNGLLAGVLPVATQEAAVTLTDAQLRGNQAAAALPVDLPAVPTETAADAAGAQGVAAVTPDATATAAATAPVTLPAVAGVAGTTLWDEGGAQVAVLESGASLTVAGRSEDGNWLVVVVDDAAGWVKRADLVAYGLQKLPVAAVPAAVTAAPVAAATPAATAAESEEPATASEISPVAVTAEAAGVAAAAVETPVLKATLLTEDVRLNVRSGPGTGYAIVAKAAPEAELAVVGRSDDGSWLQVQLPGGEAGTGWVAAEFVAVEGSLDALPVPEVAPATADATAAETAPVILAAADAPAAIATAAAATGLAGTLVFQQRAGGAIYVYEFATGALRELTYGFDPAVSPDGSTVAFVREGGENGLYLIDIDGSDERLIFDEHSSLSAPKWSPDGEWILFSRNDEYVECYAVGFNQCLLPDEFAKRFPNEDPAGFPLVKEYEYKLAAVDLNGANFHDIPALNSARAADWNEGGIVYQSKAGLQRTADGADAVNQEVAFDNLKPYYFDPDWQPGGGQIVFQMKGAAQYDLYVVNPDGSGMTALTRPATTLVDKVPSNVAPAYSPDGKQIVFLSNRGEDGEAGAWHLWVMEADGSNQRRLPIDVAIEYDEGLEQVVSWGW